MEQIINYRDIPTDKKTDILNALEQIGFIPAYGGVKTMQRVMEKLVPGSEPQFNFVFRKDKLIGYNFLIGYTKRYKASQTMIRSSRRFTRDARLVFVFCFRP